MFYKETQMKDFAQNLKGDWINTVKQLFDDTTTKAGKNKKCLKNGRQRGWASLPDCFYIYLLIRYYRPKVIVEVGTLTGTVTNIMLQGMLDSGYIGKIYTCDKNDVFDYWGKKKHSMVSYYNMLSSEMLDILIKHNIKIDFCFYDAMIKKYDREKLLKLYRGRPVFATHDFKGNQKGDHNIEKMNKKIKGKIVVPEQFEIENTKINSSVAVIEGLI